MRTLLETINAYGPLLTSLATLVYLVSIKIHSIADIKASVDKIAEKLEKHDAKQMEHEGRISRLEGRLNGHK